MKIVGINMVAEGSTGTIMLQIAKEAREQGHTALTFSCPSFSLSHPEKFIPYEGHEYFGTRFGHALHYILGRLTGKNGHFSAPSTRGLIRKIKKFQPDIIHIHNLHNFCINFPLFFRFLKKANIPVVWTLHDCWAFTGHCPSFETCGCEKWKEGCHHCSQISLYPESRKDRSREEYLDKKAWYGDLDNLTLVTPSAWLSGLVKQSFLKEHPVKVIHNGIDLSVFRVRESSFREKYGLENKFLLLGVSFGWTERKGLDVFLDLARNLGEDYKIVLVGADKGEVSLPDNIISIPRTANREELAEIYSAADLFVNPTREDNFPTVNMEALACGTPVLTFKTGGSPEIPDEKCGLSVPKGDVESLTKEIKRIREEKPFTKEDCLNRAKSFEKKARFQEYLSLYQEILNNKR